MSVPAVRVSSRPARATAQARPGWRTHLSDGWLLRLFSVVAILVFWELYGRSRTRSCSPIPRPSPAPPTT